MCGSVCPARQPSYNSEWTIRQDFTFTHIDWFTVELLCQQCRNLFCKWQQGCLWWLQAIGMGEGEFFFNSLFRAIAEVTEPRTLPCCCLDRSLFRTFTKGAIEFLKRPFPISFPQFQTWSHAWARVSSFTKQERSLEGSKRVRQLSLRVEENRLKSITRAAECRRGATKTFKAFFLPSPQPPPERNKNPN